MRRIFTLALSSLVGVALIVLCVAVTRPEWLPAWATPWAAGADVVDAGLYCEEHGVPEKFCTLCHEELAGSLLLCKEHGGLPEDICTLCHPEVKEKYRLKVCDEHGLPESFCDLCGNGPSAAVDSPDDGWCATHNTPESLCVDCLTDPSAHETDTAKVCRQPLPTVRLGSDNLAGDVGIATTTARGVRHVHTLTANAETAFDANHFAEVRPRVSGYLREVRVDLGGTVALGAVLAVVDSPEVSAAKSQYLAAKDAQGLADVNYERTRRLVESGSVPTKLGLEDLTARNQAQARLSDAEQRLLNLGFSGSDVARIAVERDTSSLLPIAAPMAGTVVRRDAVQGEAVEPTSLLFAVADTSRMWLWLDVYEADIDAVAAGRSVRFVALGGKSSGFEGEVTWVGAEVDPTTRTTRVRAELTNTDGHLRANQFGVAYLDVGESHEAVLVPKDAVQKKDGADVVFLASGGGVYLPRRIVARASGLDDQVEVAWGLEPGQVVVTTGSYLLKTEIMKGAIGAGCCD